MSGTQAWLLPLAIACSSAAPLLAQNGHHGPPGLVLIEGGRAKIGTEVDLVEPLILDNETMKDSFIAETPQHTVDVEDFYLMPTEVTQEQYAAFISATGGKPLYVWADPTAREEARQTFLEAEGLKAKEARDAGSRYERKKFDERSWWNKSWQDVPWNVPKGDLDKPAIYVTYEDALRYAEWAGLRLMTEFEFEYAARGDSELPYSWGEEWNPNACANRDLGIDEPQPVGKYEAGARNGIFDLIGNVWEWTSSPYSPYPKYKAQKFKDRGRKREVYAQASWDANQRVSRGGSFSNGSTACRTTSRRPTDRTQTTNALGFRCASSAVPGYDTVRLLLADEVDLKVLDPDVRFLTEQPTLLQRWTSEDGTVKVPGYQVITSYERIVFGPVTELDAPNVNGLAKLTETDGPALLGFFTTSVPIAQPPLPAGTYFLTYRGPAKLEEVVDEVAPADDVSGFERFAEAAGFFAEAEQIIVHDGTGEPLASLAPARAPEHDRISGLGSFAVLPFVPPTPAELKKMEKDGVTPPPARDTLLLKAVVPSKSRGKGFTFEIPLLIEPGSVDSAWR